VFLFFSSTLRRCVLQPAVHNRSRGVVQALNVNKESCDTLVVRRVLVMSNVLNVDRSLTRRNALLTYSMVQSPS
jgi:hypothetical protein